MQKRGIFGAVSRLAGRVFGRSRRSAKLSVSSPILGEILKSNFAGIQSGPWHRVVKADWLGPYTPTLVQAWVLKLMRDDPQLHLGLAVLKSAFHGIEWRLRGGTPATRALVRKTLLEAQLWPHFLRSVLNCLDFGFQAHEVIWKLADVEIDESGPGGLEQARVLQSAYVVEELSDLDPERVQLIVNERGKFAGLKFDGTQLLPEEKCLLAVHALEFRNWYGRAILKAAYNPWYWGNWLYLYMARYAEARATPPVIATAPFDFRYDEDKDRLVQEERNTLDVIAEQAIALRNGSVAAIPWEDNGHGGNKFSLSLLQDSGRIEQFMIAINHMQALKLRAILIPERSVTQDTAVGSFAMVKEHVDMFLMILEQIKQGDLIPVMNRAAELLVRYNFGRAASVPCFEGSELARQKQQVMEELVKATIAIPQTLPNGLQYLPANLIDFQRALQSMNMPIHDVRDIAKKPGQLPRGPIVKTIGPDAE